jgi:ferredoxin
MAQGQKPIVDASLCTACGICVDACPNQALEVIDNVAKLTKPEVCDGDGACAESCPTQAITLK